jgi:hypothetical protein
VGAKQYVQVCDMVFPKDCSWENIRLEVTINMAVVHQMILRYITYYFAALPLDSGSQQIPLELVLIILKNKYLNAPNEDLIVKFVDHWVGGHSQMLSQAIEHEQSNLSPDGGYSFRQLEELIDNINWPLVSLETIMEMLISPMGSVKQLNFVREKMFGEVWRRHDQSAIHPSKQMPLRFCQMTLTNSAPENPSNDHRMSLNLKDLLLYHQT